jgi:hypothetical protein
MLGDLIATVDFQSRTPIRSWHGKIMGYPHMEVSGRELWEIGLLKD